MLDILFGIIAIMAWFVWFIWLLCCLDLIDIHSKKIVKKKNKNKEVYDKKEKTD